MSERIEVLSAVHGIAPRSDELLKLGTDFEKGRASYEALDERVTQETAEWLDVQAKAGIDIQENGKLRWQDHLRPIVKATEGFARDIDNAPVTRWFEDNRFYRQPTIHGKLEFSGERFLDEVGPIGKNISLIAPETFTALSRNASSEPVYENVQNLYRQIAHFLEKQGVERLVLEEYVEPAVKQESREDNTGLEAVNELAIFTPGLQVNYLRVKEPPYLRASNFIQGMATGVGPRNKNYFWTRQPSGPASEREEIWQQVIHPDNTTQELVNPFRVDVPHWPGFYARRKAEKFVVTNSVDYEKLPLAFAKDRIRQLGEYVCILKEYFDFHGAGR